MPIYCACCMFNVEILRLPSTARSAGSDTQSFVHTMLAGLQCCTKHRLDRASGCGGVVPASVALSRYAGRSGACRLQLSCPGADSMWCYCRSAQLVESVRGRTPQLTAQSRGVGCSDGCEPLRAGSAMSLACFPESWPACGSSRIYCGCEAGAPSATAEPHEDGEQLTLVLCHQPECYCYLLVACRAYPARSFFMELELQSSKYSCASL